MSIWEDFIDGIKDPASQLAKGELKGLVKDFKEDNTEFLRKQAAKVQRYITQLAQGAITKDQFEGYMEDIRDLTEMQKNKMSAGAKARAQRLIDGIGTLIIDGLVRLL